MCRFAWNLRPLVLALAVVSAVVTAGITLPKATLVPSFLENYSSEPSVRKSCHPSLPLTPLLVSLLSHLLGQCGFAHVCSVGPQPSSVLAMFCYSACSPLAAGGSSIFTRVSLRHAPFWGLGLAFFGVLSYFLGLQDTPASSCISPVPPWNQPFPQGAWLPFIGEWC